MQNQSTTLTILLAQFGGQILIPFASASTTAGMAEQTARNRLVRGDYPMRTVTVGGRRFVHVEDLATYIESLRQPTPRRGRPSKKMKVELRGGRHD